jgi:F-type H+-transporting ATPase subunit a
MIGSAVVLRVALPAIVLAAEKIFYIGNFPVTNTFIATILADITIIILVFFATRKMQDVPEGFQNVMEWFLEIFYNLTEDVAGKANARTFFPWFMTILIFLLVVNWWGLVPGVDSIGVVEPLELAYEEAGITSGYGLMSVLGIPSLDGRAPVALTEEQILEIEEAAAHGEEEAHGEEGTHGEEGGHHESAYGGYALKVFVRPAATDLNLPLALALISVFWTQVVGVRVLGVGYFRKFLLPPLTGMKVIDAFVGILELISEFAKIISFTFRLFGNMFAGAILLFVMTFLIPFLVPLPFYGLELFVGFMQAFVFAILTLIFFAMAVVSHEHEGEH